MKILITGGAGFIGSSLAEHFIEQGYNVVVFDNFYSGSAANLKHIRNKIEFVRGDIRYTAELEKACKGISVICHLAAISVVPASFTNPREAFDINLYGTLNVLEAAIKAGAPKVIFSSSASVYGNSMSKNGTAQKENWLPDPRSPYAITKIGMEYLFKIFAREYELDTCSLRLFNVYGPRQDPELSNAVIPNCIIRALSNQPIVIHGDGSQTRDFIFVKDVARAFELAMKVETDGDVFNIATGQSTSICELAKKIKDLTSSGSDVKLLGKRQGDVNESLADISKAKKVLGFEPTYALDEGLRRTIEYYKKRAA